MGVGNIVIVLVEEVVVLLLFDGLYVEIVMLCGIVIVELFFKKMLFVVMSFVGLVEGVFGLCKGEFFFNGLVFYCVVFGFVV